MQYNIYPSYFFRHVFWYALDSLLSECLPWAPMPKYQFGRRYGRTNQTNWAVCLHKAILYTWLLQAINNWRSSPSSFGVVGARIVVQDFRSAHQETCCCWWTLQLECVSIVFPLAIVIWSTWSRSANTVCVCYSSVYTYIWRSELSMGACEHCTTSRIIRCLSTYFQYIAANAGRHFTAYKWNPWTLNAWTCMLFRGVFSILPRTFLGYFGRDLLATLHTITIFLGCGS